MPGTDSANGTVSGTEALVVRRGAGTERGYAATRSESRNRLRLTLSTVSSDTLLRASYPISDTDLPYHAMNIQ
eukprot:2336101-Rhodomonas_salina.2